MKTTVTLSMVFICLLAFDSFAQDIEGYVTRVQPQNVVKQSVKNEKTIIPPLATKDTTEWFSPSKSTVNYKMKLIFQETFSHESLDNEWVANSGTYNMKAFKDVSKGKVLKIKCDRANGNSFIEKDLTQQLRGKDVKLQADIKLKDIKIGNQSFEKGQLCIKYIFEGDEYYACVQNLSGTADWGTYYAHQDGRILIDNTQWGNYIFHVPATAENVILYLGLQNCTGEILFKNVEIYEVEPK